MTKSLTQSSRRVFFLQLATGAGALTGMAAMVGSAHAAKDAPKEAAKTPAQTQTQTQSSAPDNALRETDPQAKAMSYASDAAKVDAKKFPKKTDTQSCGTCALFGGKAGATYGSCPIFQAKQVSAKGWCSAYTKKA